MKRRRRPLFDTLVLLDGYARNQADDYDGSELQQRVAEVIEKADRGSRWTIKKILSLPGQMRLFNDANDFTEAKANESGELRSPPSAT